jgi:hypothetical protein
MTIGDVVDDIATVERGSASPVVPGPLSRTTATTAAARHEPAFSARNRENLVPSASRLMVGGPASARRLPTPPGRRDVADEPARVQWCHAVEERQRVVARSTSFAWLVDTSDVLPLTRDPRMEQALVEQFLQTR